MNLKPLPNFGDHFPLNTFIAECLHGNFTNDDGSAYYATLNQQSDLECNPYDLCHGIVNRDFEYVMWFNK